MVLKSFSGLTEKSDGQRNCQIVDGGSGIANRYYLGDRIPEMLRATE